jgi:hypothetical protein
MLCLIFIWNQSSFVLRDSIGENAIAGDMRWAGSYGVNIDFVAQSHCAVEVITVQDIQANAVKCMLVVTALILSNLDLGCNSIACWCLGCGLVHAWPNLCSCVKQLLTLTKLTGNS